MDMHGELDHIEGSTEEVDGQHVGCKQEEEGEGEEAAVVGANR
jgi:hypothetical protein